MRLKSILITWCLLKVTVSVELGELAKVWGGRGGLRLWSAAHLTRSDRDEGRLRPTRKESRFLPVVSVVSFPNGACGGAGGDNGTCLPARACAARGGRSAGHCATGFGVCCVFMASCGRSTAENGTYFVSPGYPAAYTAAGSCQLSVLKAHPDVCQLRLDFDRFSILGPEPVHHVCSRDQFLVSGGSAAAAAPPICGLNQGNHMYVDVGVGETSPAKLTFVTGGAGPRRSWKIRVQQIPCSTIYRAEEGCLQYLTGVSGQIKSFNFDGGLQLSNQDYGICVRAERNFCGIQYEQCPDTVNNRSRSFTLSGNSNVGASAMVGSGCPADWLLVPCASPAAPSAPARPQPAPAQALCTDRLCGGTFAAEPSMSPAAVMSRVRPFRLHFHTDGLEAPLDTDNRGFCLDYLQLPCTAGLL